jgi:hypothetical protein
MMARSPSVFDPRACIDGELPRVRGELDRLDWNSDLWHVLDRRGTPKESLTPPEMAARYRPCPLDPFMYAPIEPELIEVEARLEGYDVFFATDGVRVEDPLALFRGLLRADELGRPQMPADAPLSVQSVPLLRGGEAPWARRHLLHLEMLWRLLRSRVDTDGAFADMKATAELLDGPNQIRIIEGDASAMTHALTWSVIAMLEIQERGGTRPALVPPRPFWDHHRAGQTR